MSIASRKPSVTLLHKGEGPSLIPGVSQQLTLTEQPSYAHNFPPQPFHSPTSIARNKKKREIGKCIDRQEANTMFAKRIQDRTARHFRPSSSTNLRPPLPKTSPLQQQQCELYLRERLFANGPARFPPPSFMPRWNPRRKDNTYASKMVLEDPWSLPADERLALTKRTGLRLKTLTKMYQYKVGANLPLGKAADPSKCQCYVNFCDHCNQKHTGRCLLHTQLLRDIEPDCKDVDFETCPLAKNVEDLPLHKITDPRIYIGELVRRLRAGELSEIPPFPAKILKAVIKYWSPELFSTAPVDDDDQFARKVVTTDATAQTELVVIGEDMQAEFKSSSVQTSPPDKDQPLLASNLTKTTQPRGYYNPVCTTTTSGVQADPCEMVKFKDISKRAVPTLARHICDQALQEISDEVRIRHIQTIRHGYMQQLLDMQRTEEFKRSAEKWKCSAKMEEQAKVEGEYKMEMETEDLLGVVSFAQSYLHNFPGLAMDKLKTQGHIINSDLLEIQTVYKEELNKGATKTTENSRNILDEIIQNAIYNGGTEAYMQVVDEIFLNPKLWFTKPLHDVLPVEAGNFTPVEALIMRLRALGLHFTTNGRLSADLLDHDHDEGVEDGWGNLLDDVRVKFDKSGHPNELVDSWGDLIPIQVRWNKVKDSETGRDSDPKEHRPSRYVFRIPQVIHWDAPPKKYGSQGDESDSNEELDLNADDDEIETILQKRSMFRSFHDYHDHEEPKGSV